MTEAVRFAGAWRAPARPLRRLFEWLVHPARRSRARASARRVSARSALVICHGNICRSPFAAFVLARSLPRLQVSSAGFIGPNRPSPAEAITAAAKRGVDLLPHRSRVLTPELARSADLIVVMDASQRRAVYRRCGYWRDGVVLLGDFDPGRPVVRAILDPVDQPLAVFEACYARIELCVGELAGAVTEA